MSLFSTLNTGVSGLNTASLSIATTSHNISNANNEFYTRQRVATSASIPLRTTPGDVGTGVRVDTIARIHDEFVYSRLKQSSNMLSYTSYSQQRLQEVARYYPDLQDVGIQKDITNYYNAWNDFASNPSEGAQKINLIQNAQTMATNINHARDKTRDLQNSINDELKTNVDELNRIGKQIAKINVEISRVESLDKNRANDLRDQRDHLELTMSKMIDFSVFKGVMITENVLDVNLTDQGKDYHLNISGYSFVDGATFHPIVIENSKNESAYYSVYHEQQDGRRIEISEVLRGGKIGAMLDLRGRSMQEGGFPSDGILQGYIDDLDSFAKTLIVQTNNLYGQSAQERMVSSPIANLDASIPLLNHDSSIQEGSFDVVVYDAQGKEVGRKSIEIDMLTAMNDDTDESIVGQFNKNTDDNNDNNATNDVDDFFFASYSYDVNSKEGILSLSPKSEYAQAGYTIAIEDKGTNFSGVAGLSRFFDGDNAQNIKVDSTLTQDPSKLQGFNAPIDGNNSVANAMVQMQYDKLSFYRANSTVANETIEGFYRFVTVRVATDTESIGRNNDTNQALFNTVYSEHQSISGVSIDEELVDLMKFQTAYSANAKVITAIDQMLDVLLRIK